jgi:hypothetical protein
MTCSRLWSVGSIAYHVPVNGPAALVVVVVVLVVEVADGIVFFVLTSWPEQVKPYFAYWRRKRTVQCAPVVRQTDLALIVAATAPRWHASPA